MTTLKSLDEAETVSTEQIAAGLLPARLPHPSRPRLEMRWELDEDGRPVCVWAAASTYDS